MLSKLSQGETQQKLAVDSRSVLLDPSYFGQACQELVPELVAAGGMTPSEAKAIGRAASEKGYDTMARRLGGDDPIGEIVKSARSDPAKAYRDFLQSSSRFSQRKPSACLGCDWAIFGKEARSQC
jgi:soluble lytic murein transglycosylase